MHRPGFDPFLIGDKSRALCRYGILTRSEDPEPLISVPLEAQKRFSAQINLQKLQEYAQRYKPADYKED